MAWHCSRDRQLLPPRRALAVVGSGAHAGFFHCGDGDIYWFLTRNAAPGSQAGEAGDKVEILALTAGWGDPARSLLAAAEEGAILRNDVYDSPNARCVGRRAGHAAR